MRPGARRESPTSQQRTSPTPPRRLRFWTAGGTLDGVKEQFLSAFVSGGWNGDASTHREQLATELDGIAKQTKLIGARRRTLTGAQELRRMAENDRKREAEECIRMDG